MIITIAIVIRGRGFSIDQLTDVFFNRSYIPQIEHLIDVQIHLIFRISSIRIMEWNDPCF